MDDAENVKSVFLKNTHITTRLYKKRWFMLLIYFVTVPVSTMQWSQFSMVANIMVDYYNVSYEAINWTYLITLLNFVIFIFPCSYVVDKFGIRNGALVAMGGTAIAAWIKVGSASSDKFWVTIFGQTVLSIPQICLFGVGPKLAANWFGPNEVAVANSIGVVAIQLGIALGFVLPPMLVRKETVEKDLFRTAIGLAVICTCVFILVFVFFVDKPPTPPSQASLKKDMKIGYIQATKKLIKNVPFVFVLLEMGCNLGIFCSIQNMLNQIIIRYYPNGEEDAGKIGLLMMLLCIVGCISSGIILSKFQIYRACFVGSIFFLTISLLILTCTLKINIIYPYIACTLFGFFFGSLWNVSYEIGVEITYPEPEAITVGLINGIGQAMGILFTYIYGFLFYKVSDPWANIFLSTISFLSFIIALNTKYDLKRTAANLKI